MTAQTTSEARRHARHAESIAETVADWPPLTDEQLDRIAILLNPGDKYIAPVLSEREKARRAALAERESLLKGLTHIANQCTGCGGPEFIHRGNGLGLHLFEAPMPADIIAAAQSYQQTLNEVDARIEALS